LQLASKAGFRNWFKTSDLTLLASNKQPLQLASKAGFRNRSKQATFLNDFKKCLLHLDSKKGLRQP